MTERCAGNILFISSISALQAGLALPPYAAAKAAIISYSKTLAISLAKKRVRVNALAPGSIEFEGGLWANIRINDPSRHAGRSG
ncbi:MAG TPA: SDR family NAD(P)-dependent oxidoreductase [Anaerolineales bacterium]